MDITVTPAVTDFLNRHGAITTIINCAAYNDVDRAERQPSAAMALNCEAPADLAREAVRRGLKLVSYSTDFVFDGTKQAPYREDDPARPLSVYGNSKYQGEKAVLAADSNALIIRTSWVFGVGNTNFNKAVIR
ncbi:SDR family oxidoreductase, partial [Mycobacterium tuberculosis]|uniref:SDR family oxidoreductase n=1 Tax=Mycobacterium tuberculosis TaxID=1773 RepID=UPI001F374CEE